MPDHGGDDLHKLLVRSRHHDVYLISQQSSGFPCAEYAAPCGMKCVGISKGMVLSALI